MTSQQSLARELASEEAAGQPFVPYTRLAKVEQLLERHLGDMGRFQLSERFREGVALGLPWSNLAFIPVFAGLLLMSLGIGALLGELDVLGVLDGIASLVFNLLAAPGLFRRSRRGWTMVTYGSVIGAACDVLSFSPVLLMSRAFMLWLLFQIKYRYRA